MPTPHLSLSRVAEPVADPAALARLPHAGASHDDVRRYSRARRNLLPRADRVTAVAGGWALEAVLRSGASVEALLWCPGDRGHPALELTAARVVRRSERAVRISERTLTRLHPGLTAPALLAVVRLPRLAGTTAGRRGRAGAGGRRHRVRRQPRDPGPDGRRVRRRRLGADPCDGAGHPSEGVRGEPRDGPHHARARVRRRGLRARGPGRGRLHDVRRRPGRRDPLPPRGTGIRSHRRGRGLGG